jgi:hypothetical protein
VCLAAFGFWVTVTVTVGAGTVRAGCAGGWLAADCAGAER